MPLLGGVRPPIAALLCLVLAISAFTALAIDTTGQDEPRALREAERQIAADAAASFRTAVHAHASTLRRSAAEYAAPAGGATPAAALKALLPTRRAVRGSVLLDPRTDSVRAASGEAVPLTGVSTSAQMRNGHNGDIAPRLVAANGGPRLLLFARVTLVEPAPGQDDNQDQAQDLKPVEGRTQRWLLVVSETIAAPVVHGSGRTVQLVNGDGKVLAGAAADGATLPTATTPDAVEGTLPAAAARAALAVPLTTDASGSLLGGTGNGRRAVAGWASVAAPGGGGDTADLGLTVLTSRAVAATEVSGGSSQSLPAAGALAVIAVLVTLLLVGAVQRPLLRLHLSAARLARGASDAPEAEDDLARPVPVPAFGEPARAGRALESVRRQLLGETGPQDLPVRRSPGTRALVVVCALLVGAWGLPMLFMVDRVDAAAVIPADLLADHQARTQAAADRVRQSLDQSSTELAAAAAALVGESPAREADTLRRVLAEHSGFRSLYVLDRSGATVLRVGKDPLRTVTHAPTGNGITRVNTSGRIPAIAAYAQIPAAKAAAPATGDAAVLFGEIDVAALNSVLPRAGLGSVWLTDEKHRVLAASVGFRAFQSLPGPGLTRLAVRTEGAAGTAGSPTSAVLGSGDAGTTGSSVAAAAPLAQSGPTAALGWRVVSAEPAAALKLAAYEVQRRTMLAGLLALTAGIACLGWLHIVVIRPLRALTGCAERIAGGDRRTVLYPVNHDETGSVTRSLELLRQALVARDRRSEPDRAPIPAPSSPRPTARQF